MPSRQQWLITKKSIRPCKDKEASIMAITLTDKAAKHVQRNLDKRGKGCGLRLGVRTTGCSGLAYQLEYVDEAAPEDAKFESNGIITFMYVADSPSIFNVSYNTISMGIILPAASDICSS